MHHASTNPLVAIYKAWNARHALKNTTLSQKLDTVQASNFDVAKIPSNSKFFEDLAINSVSRNAAASTPFTVFSTTSQRRVSYFVRRGNKARRESLFRSLWNRPKRKPLSTQKHSFYKNTPSPLPAWVSQFKANKCGAPLESAQIKASKEQQNSNQVRRNFGALYDEYPLRESKGSDFNLSNRNGSTLRSFSLAATPYVKLVGRRRGRRTVYKIHTVSRHQGQRQSLIALADTRYTRGSATKSFAERFKKQRTTILASPVKDRKPGSASTGSLRDKRDELHQHAFASRPPHWRRSE